MSRYWSGARLNGTGANPCPESSEKLCGPRIGTAPMRTTSNWSVSKKLERPGFAYVATVPLRWKPESLVTLREANWKLGMAPKANFFELSGRSEERRVGKECR